MRPHHVRNQYPDATGALADEDRTAANRALELLGRTMGVFIDTIEKT